MKDDGTKIELFGRVATGWQARIILISFLLMLVGTGATMGYKAGLHHICGI